MITIDENKNRKIHTRNISIAIYLHTDDSIIVEGRLLDERLLKSYRLSGGSLPPCVVHHMIIRLIVRGPELVIEDIDVEMPTFPHEECSEVKNSLLPVIGLQINSGFTVKVKDLVGGAKGCAHLLALLIAMAPAAVQGAWSAATRQPVASETISKSSVARMKNTCYVWRSDGPNYTKLKQEMDPNG